MNDTEIKQNSCSRCICTQYWTGERCDQPVCFNAGHYSPTLKACVCRGECVWWMWTGRRPFCRTTLSTLYARLRRTTVYIAESLFEHTQIRVHSTYVRVHIHSGDTKVPGIIAKYLVISTHVFLAFIAVTGVRMDEN
jgi:hypothetical protein